ncbi:MAG: hypothetical protein A3F04_01245 [Candidatus Chisholmbacteria bacterium RIFCSPHIGHO2_12_FULL_49_9]|uniref:GlcNAc-PI de-N-acetylase n=1 Tax=Candidatus Chisholmbacteria bacterium RIFCSPHIGHO2_01_FULL_52_32 TaxID=1797591 RepID=A0A1G1VT81_9BACT|nr:MAG: hypothetical protein A2786_03935 [Candidatus Chisholmbacteria bacterium RIFCSPHIGHO2_01_FULL_52_32]OGY20008.1 MAG: hypothetical protein A2900_02810 [Candidatus Chisholmbacteria bacterium RIFCSPLOWO2_01_FULL_50_28]OGY21208.1 MAG: hypothetical protein A3F04_01245 [Candidatus Chisholmbacteria bacterium RIFCSPHIGHO2_12_FULL_49_9]
MAVRKQTTLDLSKQRLLIIAPHPDDEVIGCGGLMVRVKEEGGKVYVLIMTVGDTNDFSKTGYSSQKERMKEIDDVANYFRLDGCHVALGGNSNHLRLDQQAQLDLISIIERGTPVSIETVKPTMILFPQLTSYNQDHRAATRAAFAACRPASRRYKSLPKLILSYEEAADQWSLEHLPPVNFFVGISARHLHKKISGLRLYQSQWRARANPRSAKALAGLAALRGAQTGVNLAEAFFCQRFLA